MADQASYRSPAPADIQAALAALTDLPAAAAR
jgi:hypothetical protein